MKRPAIIFVILLLGCVFAEATPKPYPKGIVDLPFAISASKRIGTIAQHGWQYPFVSGVRIRTGWIDIEGGADNTYDWSLIEESLTLARSVHKFVGLSFVTGYSSATVKAPQWLRDIPGVEFHNLAAPDNGGMVTPWDPTFKAKCKEFIAALGARYDANPNVGYVVMTGFQKTSECYLAKKQADVDFYNASAVAHGYAPSATLPAGLVAWEATAKEMIAAWMTAFPNTPLFVELALPYPSKLGGEKAMNDIVAWGIATYPGRFGLMNAGLNAVSKDTYFANARVYENRHTEPTGFQLIWYSNPSDRLSQSKVNGTNPRLTPAAAMSATLRNGSRLGGKFIEVYSSDIRALAYKTMLQASSDSLGGVGAPLLRPRVRR